MHINQENFYELKKETEARKVTLVAVSKTKPAEAIMELYQLGHRDFGENYVQELVDKAEQLPKDILWHFIGHLQSNKVKYIAPFVHLIHGVDSFKLLNEIDRQAQKNSRIIDVLLQVHIAKEETKFGLSEEELGQLLADEAQLPALQNVQVKGLMGMASFSNDKELVRQEFQSLKNLFDKHSRQQTHNIKLQTLSMGMSGDYELAMNEGSTMVRIGSLLFGVRN